MNIADAPTWSHPKRAVQVRLEPDGAQWPDTGVNVQIMQPGQPNCRYHSEPVQEDFLVLHGECIVILDGDERPLRLWDFVHCPAGVEHPLAHSSQSLSTPRRPSAASIDARARSSRPAS